MNMVVHAGGRYATFDEVCRINAPAPSGRWHPVAHRDVVELVKDHAPAYGFNITDFKHALRNDGKQYFGLMTVDGPESLRSDDMSLQIGLRNSIDKSLAISLVAGSQVFVCDNLAFSGEVALSRKHTTNVWSDVTSKISTAFNKLIELFGKQKGDIENFKQVKVEDFERDILITRTFRDNILPSSKFNKLDKQLHSTDPVDCGGVPEPTLWRFFNGVTQVMKNDRTAVDTIAERTSRLFRLCNKFVDIRKEIDSVPVVALGMN